MGTPAREPTAHASEVVLGRSALLAGRRGWGQCGSFQVPVEGGQSYHSAWAGPAGFSCPVLTRPPVRPGSVATTRVPGLGCASQASAHCLLHCSCPALPPTPSHPPPAPPPAGLPDCPNRPQPVSLSPGPTGRDARLPPLCPPYPKGGQEPRSCSLQGRRMSEQGWRRHVTKSRDPSPCGPPASLWMGQPPSLLPAPPASADCARHRRYLARPIDPTHGWHRARPNSRDTGHTLACGFLAVAQARLP